VPPTSEPARPQAVAVVDALADLPVVIEDIECVAGDFALPSYPGGPRPTATVTLHGLGATGRGEHVAWTADDHARLCDHAARAVPRGSWRLGAWSVRVAAQTPWAYARAALEAAAIDLGLRQRQTNLFELTATTARPVRYVVSFDRRADPVAEAERWLVRQPGLRFKIDVDPSWDVGVYRGLAALHAVATLDFKGGGEEADHERARERLPEAFIEDPALAAAPWSAALRRQLSFDAPVLAAGDIARLPVRPAAVNVKPARMGGVLEALRCIAVCDAEGIGCYFGGMFEVGVGRRQLWSLAALFAADASNDVAPLSAAAGDNQPELPLALAVDDSTPGFGGSCM
jgi:L-alanine-DL-glutamate epimerase-like enolase superfamily enzyme